jgi:glutathione S-transferase
MSTASITAAVLAELGIDSDRVKLTIADGDTQQPDFLKLNPNGRVPVIVHDGTTIWESAAITMYLGEVFGVEAKLYPPLGTQRGEAMKWIVWGNVTLAAAGGRLSAMLPSDSDGGVVANSQDWIPPEQRSEIALANAKAELVGCLGILDNALVGKLFLLDEYSLVDTHLQGFVGWIGSMDVALEPFQNVTGWLERCYQRPAIAQLMEE